MGWFSLLPDHLSFVETFLARTCMLIGIIILGPWVLVLIYDILLYLWRYTTYEMPYIGGRARGRQRPSPPSLTTRAGGHRRHISLPGIRSHRSGMENDSLKPTKRRSTHSAVPKEDT